MSRQIYLNIYTSHTEKIYLHITGMTQECPLVTFPCLQKASTIREIHKIVILEISCVVDILTSREVDACRQERRSNHQLCYLHGNLLADELSTYELGDNFAGTPMARAMAVVDLSFSVFPNSSSISWYFSVGRLSGYSTSISEWSSTISVSSMVWSRLSMEL